MYKPTRKLLQNYAEVLVNFALHSGKGIKQGEVVFLQFDVPALPLALEVYRVILQNKAHGIVRMNEEEFSSIFYKYASDSQLTFFPKKYNKALVDTIDHRIYLIADRNPLRLKDADPKKIMKANKSAKPLKDWLNQKEDRGKLTWTLALYGTQGFADQAGLSLKQYWEQIEKACYLDSVSPIVTWQKAFADMESIRKQLSEMPIKSLRVQAKETDLTILLGEKRKWMGGSGRNIPSFELFTSPDWRGTQGHIYFDYPLYRYGNIIKDIQLTFQEGKVVKASAVKNEKLLKALIAQKGADRIGEYSLTDVRFSRITKFMANTLYDENFGGKYGNTHLAVGSSYHDAYAGEVKKLSKKDFKDLGFNESVEHTDIIQTIDRVVTARLYDNTDKVIYAKGQFQI